MNAILTYINESIEELRHVRWPTRQQAIRLSIVVIGFSAVCALAFGGLDVALSEGLRFILSFGS